MSILVYGLINSAILALLATGFNVTFGISGVANFTYGAIYIFSGFLIWILLNQLGLPYLISAGISVICAFILGVLIYYLVIQRIKGLALSEVIATFGIGVAIMELFRFFHFVGSKYAIPAFVKGSVMIFGVPVDWQRIIIVFTAALLTLGLYLFTRHTKVGLAFRAIAQDEYTALTFGMETDRIAALSMGLGCGLGAIASLVILPLGTITVEGGYDVLLNALAVCIVGGLGSTWGVLLASLIIGLAQSITAYKIATHWVMLVSLISIALILAIKPSGLLSHQKELEERV